MANKINIEQIEEHLKQAGLDNGELENLLNPIKELNNQRRYGLVWEEPDSSTYNTDSAEQELLRNFPFLKEVNEHRIFNGEEHPDHLLIEGDNLHALKTMQYTHKNKIDVIYIDPPYNTGNTDFVYNDKYVDNEDSWRHSKWLSFMNKRLRLARELMTDEGVIFISIDDNEYAQLKLLCDQVFGEDNFVRTFIIDKTAQGANQSKTFKLQHEYLHMYVKNNREKIDYDMDIEIDTKKYKYKDEIGHYATTNKFDSINSPLARNKNRGYTIYYKSTDDIVIEDEYDKERGIFGEYNETLIEEGYVPIRPSVRNGTQYPWNWSVKSFWEKYKTELIFKENQEGKMDIYHKNRFDGKVKDTTIKSFDTRVRGKGVVVDMGIGDFSYPKSIDMMKWVMSKHKNKNATVLDFFAGSGTTAHAVMELNKEDGGNRQAIVITNNEINSSEEEDLLVEKGYVEQFTGSRRGTKKHVEWLESVNEFKTTPEYLEFIETDEYKDLGIARAVTEQRINKVINGYTTPKNKEVEGLDNNNFYHFEVVLEPDLLDMDLNTYVLVNKTKDIIRMKEGVYTEEEDISTETVPSVKLTGKDKEVIVVLSVRVTDADIEELLNNFKYSEKEHVIYTSYTGFEYGINNIRFEELPKELLQAIKHDDNN